MKFGEFRKLMEAARREIPLEVYRENRDTIDIKKEKTAVKNYGRIFEAVFRISSAKGFQAMSLRDLSRETGLSMGALYRYFSSKEELLSIIQLQGQSMIKRAMEQAVSVAEGPAGQLGAAVKTHIFLSEAAREWFFFSFMEARSLEGRALEKVIEMEAFTERILVDILKRGEDEGIFHPRDHVMTASIIKAMQQDWYLKRWKYHKRNITVDDYAETVLQFISSYCFVGDAAGVEP